MGEKTLEIIQLNESHRDAVAPLIAGFRSTLLSYKGIQSEPDTKDAVLFEKAEETAAGMGEETVYNYVHPNNAGMISFLRSKGYTVLNLIEIRKPYTGEKLSTKVHVDNEEFDY